LYYVGYVGYVSRLEGYSKLLVSCMFTRKAVEN